MNAREDTEKELEKKGFKNGFYFFKRSSPAAEIDFDLDKLAEKIYDAYDLVGKEKKVAPKNPDRLIQSFLKEPVAIRRFDSPVYGYYRQKLAAKQKKFAANFLHEEEEEVELQLNRKKKP